MVRSSPFRKFAPLAAIAVVQLLIILLVPSVAPATVSVVLSQGGAGGTSGTGPAGSPGSGTPGSALPGAPGVTPGGTPPGATGGAGASSTGAGTTGTGSVTGSATVEAGDTKHCVAGRQYDPSIDYFSPPCSPGIPGAAYPGDNGGATWQGVAKDRIELVNYIPSNGAEVDTILKAQGLYYNTDNAKVFNAAFENFINSHYQLYGRKVHIDSFQGTCSNGPPDVQCLNGEMDNLVATYHPYAVVYSQTLCSACFAELARLKVVSTGDAGFSDAFRNANAPYIYDQGMSSTRVEQQFADFWCHQLTSQGGSGRTAVFAGAENPAEDFRSKPRVLGVIATNDPDIEATVKNVLYPALKKGCGEVVTHEYFYANDISTATQQSNAGIAAMNTSSNPATSVLCLCDPVAPQFVYNASSVNNYWPEQFIASDQAMDTDAAGQTFVDSGGTSSLSCPSPQRGCPFDGALGIGSFAADVAPAEMSGVKVFKLGGGQTLPVTALTLQVFWENYSMLASLIQNTGPILTPARMQAAAPSLGMRGGGTTGYALRGFAPGEWTWTRDVRMLWFDKHKPSPYNATNGRWIQMEGGRKDFGQFTALNQPPAPPASAR
ncbi:MAG: hypothetical protein M3O32_00510 [Actinomycetota bacterium]|nr:hypothetical protein [Actinomycetota bacterium]